MKCYTVFLDRAGAVEVKLGKDHERADHEDLLRRPSDFAEFAIPGEQDEGMFLKRKFATGVTRHTSVVVTVGAGRAKAWRVSA